MQSLSPDPALGPGDPGEAERFRERMARAGASDPARGRRKARPGERKGGLKLGWKTWLAIDGIGLILFVTAVVVWPPLSACREKARDYGLYAGDTIEKCTRRGIAERLERADQRVKMLIRGSGR